MDWGALIVIVPTGILMFMAHAGDFISNRAFVLKLALIFAAAINAAIFHVGPSARSSGGTVMWRHRLAAKLHAALSLMIWMGVIACGRLLAYL